ncbi:hypothetical protein KAW08_05220 [bacterium]|nr:hypothetical protein [bacterium]
MKPHGLTGRERTYLNNMTNHLTIKQKKAVVDFYTYYQTHEIPEDLTGIIKDNFGIDITSKYCDKIIKNPVIVAPGQITRTTSQVNLISKAGYGGFVLKSFVGEDQNGHCSMSEFRMKPEWIKTFYEPDDTKGERPIIHWKGRLDERDLNLYKPFAQYAHKIGMESGVCAIASILCHLPRGKEDWIEDEWIYTTSQLYELGYHTFEIDFCPYLKSNNIAKNKDMVLRWYKEAPKIMKKVSCEIKVFSKLLNPEWGDEFQIQMVEASIEGKADGVVVANRIYKEQYQSAHGGKELKEINLRTIKNIRKKGIKIPVSATGGIYTGKDVIEYIEAGAENTQLISYIMGRARTPFVKKGNKFKQVLFKLILDPEDGIIQEMLKIKNSLGISSVSEFSKIKQRKIVDRYTCC